jgi:PleD family two-component response regulator
MSKARFLIVEDDVDILNLLRIYFANQNYEVDTAVRGSEALEKTRHCLPHLIILDIMLPDIDGFEVCRVLRTNIRTSHVPIIFLTQKDERSDKLQGFQLGADDYVTKPFDIEELHLRARRAIDRAEQQSLTDPRSGLPSGRLIEEHLRRLIRQDEWAYMDIRIQNFEPFKEVYGFVAGDDVLRFTAMLLNEVVEENGSVNDFIGHPGGDSFILTTTESAAPVIRARLKQRFDEEVLSHYNFLDRQQGYILTDGADGKPSKVGFMNLAIGEVSPSKYDFADIREITEVAAEARRHNAA